MNDWLVGILSAVGSIVLTLTTTLIFNYCVGLPKKMRQERERERVAQETLQRENEARDQKISKLEAAIDSKLPAYRQYALEAQEELKHTDEEIIALCREIGQSVKENREELVTRLKRLESREKNSLRAKILDEYRLYTDERKNPKKAWSEMEQHSFFELVNDYEDLGGNDFIHSAVIPAMHNLHVVRMHDVTALKELYDSRKI